MLDDKQLYDRVKSILYSLTGISLAQNKDVMISNRLYKFKRDTKYSGHTRELLDKVEDGSFVVDFINSFTTNKTNFFREDFHFIDLRDRVLPLFANSNQEIKMYCSASSTGEEPYSMAMTVLEVQEILGKTIKSSILATDIDTNVLQYAAKGVYGYLKSSKEFPNWIKPQKYFRKKTKKNSPSQEILIKVRPELQKMITFQTNNLSNPSYPYKKNYFDVIFCRNVLIYFSLEDQNKILRRLFPHLKIGGTLYIGHSENPHDLTNYVRRVGQNIFVKTKELH